MPEQAPYDVIAEQWSQERHASGFREQPYVDRFLDLTEPGANILDLGCGAGRLIGRYLLDRGFRLTGVDAPLAMLDLARTNCPEAELIVGDMLSIALSNRYDGIIAWDSIFHIPKAQHPALFDNLHRWLRPGAPVLLSLGAKTSSPRRCSMCSSLTVAMLRTRPSHCCGRPASTSCYQKSTTRRREATWPCCAARRVGQSDQPIWVIQPLTSLCGEECCVETIQQTTDGTRREAVMTTHEVHKADPNPHYS
jgi:hypothetical protein